MDIPLPENLIPFNTLGLDVPPCGETPFEELVEEWREEMGDLADGRGVLVRDLTSVAEARAAVLAARDLGESKIAVTFACDDEGLTSSEVDVLAALIVMEGMDVTAFGISCPAEDAPELMQRLSRHATVPLFRLRGENFLPYNYTALGRDPDVIPCAGDKEARFITPDVDVGDTLECSPDLLEDILAAEDAPVGAVKIAILSEDDLPIFEEYQYAIRDALCLWSDVPELMEKALRLYQGRAFYDGTGDLEPDFLKQMSRKYGLVVL